MTRIIGVTGGIGSGKSSVARILGELGATVIDADALARDVVEPGSPTLDALVARFGPDIVDSSGNLLRAKLAAMAFADPQGTEDLNAIMHPPIARLAADRIARSSTPVVVYDMPLLVETKQHELVDMVIVVDVSPETQMERALARGTLTEEDIKRRLNAQASRDERLAISDYVLSNDGTPDELRRQVEDLWQVFANSAE